MGLLTDRHRWTALDAAAADIVQDPVCRAVYSVFSNPGSGRYFAPSSSLILFGASAVGWNGIFLAEVGAQKSTG